MLHIPNITCKQTRDKYKKKLVKYFFSAYFSREIKIPSFIVFTRRIFFMIIKSKRKKGLKERKKNKSSGTAHK